MVFRCAELEYDNVELIRGQSHVIKFTQRSNTAERITISCNTTLCSLFLGDKFNGSILLEVNMSFIEVKVLTSIRTIINYPCRT